MEKVIHKSYNQNDSLLLPPSLGELIPLSHPVRIVSDIIDKFDISAIEATYKGGGHPASIHVCCSEAEKGYCGGKYQGK